MIQIARSLELASTEFDSIEKENYVVSLLDETDNLDSGIMDAYVLQSTLINKIDVALMNYNSRKKNICF